MIEVLVFTVSPETSNSVDDGITVVTQEEFDKIVSLFAEVLVQNPDLWPTIMEKFDLINLE